MTSARHRIVNRIHGLPVTAEGEVQFELLLNGQHVASHAITITVQPPEETTGVTHYAQARCHREVD
jgi:hypothetical protein